MSTSATVEDKNKQYLKEDILLKEIPKIKISISDLGSTDTYHEEKILKKYLSIDKEGQILVYKSAIQLAIIGYGNKNYGFIRINEKEIMNLVDIFKKYNIKYLEKINSKYTDDDLSVRRLLRLFRCQVQNFIVENNRPSYLWLKYGNKVNNDKYRSICFPGGEHLVNNPDEAAFLLETYGNLDTQLSTKFRQRLQRVFIARGILSPNYFESVHYWYP